jgi:hypothetical protein
MHYCSHQCVDFIEDDEDCDPYYDYFCKPKWNEPRRRCYEGIPIDKRYLKLIKMNMNLSNIGMNNIS